MGKRIERTWESMQYKIAKEKEEWFKKKHAATAAKEKPYWYYNTNLTQTQKKTKTEFALYK